VKRGSRTEPPTLGELEVITEHTPERLWMTAQLPAWRALRFGELAELRRRDIDLDRKLGRVRRAVFRADGRFEVGEPKSGGGTGFATCLMPETMRCSPATSIPVVTAESSFAPNCGQFSVCARSGCSDAARPRQRCSAG
jgi:hypothetical protein